MSKKDKHLSNQKLLLREATDTSINPRYATKKKQYHSVWINTQVWINICATLETVLKGNKTLKEKEGTNLQFFVTKPPPLVSWKVHAFDWLCILMWAVTLCNVLLCFLLWKFIGNGTIIEHSTLSHTHPYKDLHF